MESLVKLALELKRVADLNNDTFDLTIEIDVVGRAIYYEIVCEEDTDSHSFLSVRDVDLDQAAIRAFAMIPDACKEWGYKV